MMEFRKKKVVVMGLGLNQGGLGVARYLVNEEADVIVTDMKTATELQETIEIIKKDPKLKHIKLVLGEHRNSDIDQADYVVKNPAVPLESPFIQYAYQKGVPVITEFDIFFDAIQSRKNVLTIGVTGTRGKSTTTALIAHILQRVQDLPVYLVGNIRKSALDILHNLPDKAIICIELSSFQLELLKHSPDIAVFTSFFPDHLNRHHTLEEYFRAKSQIFLHQKSGGKLIINDDIPVLHTIQTSLHTNHLIRVSRVNLQANYVLSDALVIQNQEIMHTRHLRLQGEHNQMNASLAVAAVHQALGTEYKVEKVNMALQEFNGLPGRQQIVATIRGVDYVNDTTSTMPDALVTALKSFYHRSLVLIIGGNDKGLDYYSLKEVASRAHIKKIFLTPGSASKKLQEVFPQSLEEVKTTHEAFVKATQVAIEGDVVLFSPGATSYGEFRHEFERGDAFDAYVLGLR